ncbi:class I SAM-dependent methyltransferase [Nocardia crassostreae]|uniref:class I SAM-dependent methyltransferase n=1 Tax=Nocardia crassostreae TaxID=53428 RepID=UPI00082F7E0A|nr:class I SAM-dependent methyltransferase [Nocardia crassostreae]
MADPFEDGGELTAERLRLLGEILNEPSIAVLRTLGIRPEWRCWDIGSGAGHIANWMSATGASVLATDLHTGRIRVPDTVDVAVHDVRTDPLPGRFDLIHARLLFMRLPEPERVVARLVPALKPGGVLMISDWDRPETEPVINAPDATSGAAAERVTAALRAAAGAAGIDFDWARRTPTAFLAAGLSTVTTHTASTTWTGNSSGCRLLALYSRLLQTSPAATAALRDDAAALTQPELMLWSPRLFTTTGRAR